MSESGISELQHFASAYDGLGLTIHEVFVSEDERQDGEPVLRIVLLLDDPQGDTWDVEQVRKLRDALGRRAVELALPPVSVTLIPEGNRDAFERVAG